MNKILLSTLGVAFSSYAFSTTELASVKVTAKGFNSSLYTESTDVQTIYIDELESMKSSLSDILSSASGVQISQNGGTAQYTNVQLDGINLKNTLVLINGQAIGSATLGQASLNQIPVNQIDRIEILKGSGSSLYGSSAMGGVINIITKQSGNQLSIARGSFDETDVSARFQTKVTNQLTTGLNISHQKSEGINSRIGSYYDFNSGTSAEYDTDKDGNENTTLTGNVNYQENNLSISNSVYVSKGDIEFDAPGGDDKSSFENTQINTQINYTFDSINLSSMLSRHTDQSKNYGVINTKENADEFTTKSNYLSVQGQYNSDLVEAILGTDWKRDDIGDSKLSTDYQKSTTDNISVFTQNAIRLSDNIMLALGTRLDDHSAFGQKQTFNTSVVSKLSDHQLTISHESGFKAPTFNDLYFPTAGNPDLKPEESLQTSVRYDYSNDTHELNIKAYYTELDNLIAWAPTEANANIWQPANVNEAIIKGWRASIKENWTSQLSTSLSGSRTITENKEDNKELALTPEYSVKAKIGYTTGSYMLSTDITYTGSRFGSDRTEKLNGYKLANISANYRINNNANVGLIIKNLADQNYVPNTQYEGIPRSLLVSLRYEL